MLPMGTSRAKQVITKANKKQMNKIFAHAICNFYVIYCYFSTPLYIYIFIMKFSG